VNTKQKFSPIFDKEESAFLELEESSAAESLVEASLMASLTSSEMLKYSVELENLLNSQYIGQLYIGSPKLQYADLSFDTGSNWLTVTSSLGANRGEKAGAYDLK